mgnify:CR=1 FL=1
MGWRATGPSGPARVLSKRYFKFYDTVNQLVFGARQFNDLGDTVRTLVPWGS